MKILNTYEITYILKILKRILKGIDKENGYNETEYELLKDLIKYIENK